MKKFEIFQVLPECAEVSKSCWENGADRLAHCKVVKNPIPAK